MKWIQSIKWTGNLPSEGGFITCDYRFDKKCFERDWKITILVLLWVLNFVSACMKSWTFQATVWLFSTKISHYKDKYEDKYAQHLEAKYFNKFALAQNIQLQLMATWSYLSTFLLFIINLPSFNLFNTESAVFRTTSIKHTNVKSPNEQEESFEVFFKKRCSYNFWKITRKKPVPRLRLVTVLKKRLRWGLGVYLWILRNF